jgi:hypothetical protein
LIFHLIRLIGSIPVSREFLTRNCGLIFLRDARVIALWWLGVKFKLKTRIWFRIHLHRLVLDYGSLLPHVQSVRRPSSIIMLVLTLGVAGGIVAWVICKSGKPAAVQPRIGYQDADYPLLMPMSGEIDHRFQFPSAWQTSVIPRALRFDPPMGSEHGGFAYNAQKYWEMNEKRGGHHSGDDLNGIGGMDTDLGDPVFVTANGLVLYTGEPSPGWGKLVVVAHKTSDGKTLHSMYAHLDRIDVAPGALIPRGGKLGTVGTANGYYPAHLHFEMRASDQVDIGGGYLSVSLNHLDPSVTVASLRNAAPDDLSPSPLAAALSNVEAPWTSLEIQGSEKFSVLPGE